MSAFRKRDLHALWIAAVVLSLALWFDAFPVLLLILFALGVGALVLRWIVWVLTPPDRRDRF